MQGFRKVKNAYIGRLAPTPTGHLHLGHVATFQTVWERSLTQQGSLVLRVEDLDIERCKPEYVQAAEEDLSWLGFTWDAGPYFQSRRYDIYLKAWNLLKEKGLIYPCNKSRKDVEEALRAPHKDGKEPIYPVSWRPEKGAASSYGKPSGVNWRFRVPDGEVILFKDGHKGEQSFEAGKDFGDFVIWRRDDIPAYELAVVVDDIEMGITEVVRGEDLLLSTARQILIYRALETEIPDFWHTSLVRDVKGERLAKRNHALSIKALREEGYSPAEVIQMAREALKNRLKA